MVYCLQQKKSLNIFCFRFFFSVDGDSFAATRIVLGRHEIKTMEKVSLGSNRLRIMVPNPVQTDENITLTINTEDIVKFIYHLEVNSTLVFSVTSQCIDKIWTQLRIERKLNLFFEYFVSFLIFFFFVKLFHLNEFSAFLTSSLFC